MIRYLIAAASIALTSPAFAEGMRGAEELEPRDIVFKDDPAFPKGGQTAVVYGDPSKPGLFIIRAKFPPNYLVPPHTHPVFESVTVLSGSMGSGMGVTVDKAKGRILGAGSLLLLPANDPHYVWSGDEETIIQVAAVGPFDLVYTDPKDDPRKR